jgi:hypothetical protein
MKPEKLYITIDTDQKDNINWGAENIIEGKDNLRHSLDGTEFIIKWSAGVNTPPSVLAIPSEDKSNILTHQQAKTLMATPEWTDPNPPV